MGTAVCIQDLGAVIMKTFGTLFARTVTFKTGVALGTYTDGVSYFDITPGLGTDTGDFANDFVPDDNGV